MNFLPAPVPSELWLQPRAVRRFRDAFRLLANMPAPARWIAIDFQLEPECAWIARSFIAWFRPSPAVVLAWLD